MTATGTSARPSTSVIAHRGASSIAPENTLAAVELAITEGAAAIECDIQRTADGELVVIHDSTAGRTTNVDLLLPRLRPWNVAELTLAQLQSLDAGAWFDVAYAGERIPTLAEWLNQIGPRAGMQIEVKHPTRKPELAEQLSEILRGNQWARRALHDRRLVVQSFDHDWLRDDYRPLAEGVQLGALVKARPSTRQVAAIAGWAQQLNPRLGATDRALIDCAHSHGLAVCVWTVDRTSDMRRLMDASADAIITNEPAKLSALVRRQAATV